MFQDYYKALEDADEKVQLANQIYDLVSEGVSQDTDSPVTWVTDRTWAEYIHLS